MDVSIIICTRDRAGQLRDALEYLLAVRSDAAWEAVIVDNGSTDATREVILEAVQRNPRVRYLFEPQPGVGAARDTAWRAASGRIISFTDDDCYISPDYPDKVIEVFRESPELGYLGGRVLLFDPQDARITIDERDRPERYSPRKFLPAGSLMCANFSIRRDVLEAIGGFDRRTGAGTPFPFEDIDIVARAAWHGAEGGFDPRPIVFHHHRRSAADVPKLQESYDRGRGGYYMKFILRRESRLVYASGWLEKTLEGRSTYRWPQLAREINSARQFLRLYGTRREILVFSPLLLSAGLLTSIVHASYRAAAQYIKYPILKLRSAIYRSPDRNE